MVGCVEGILGIRPDLYGLKLSPAIPDEWNDLSIKKIFRNKLLNISIHNNTKQNKLILNGEELDTNYIKEEDLLKENTIELFLKKIISNKKPVHINSTYLLSERVFNNNICDI